MRTPTASKFLQISVPFHCTKIL